MTSGIYDNSLPNIMKLYPQSKEPSVVANQYSRPIGPSLDFTIDNSKPIESNESNPNILEKIAPKPIVNNDSVRPGGGRLVNISRYNVDPFIPPPYKTDRVIGVGRAVLDNKENYKNKSVNVDKDFIEIEDPNNAAIDIINKPMITVASLKDLRRMYSILKSIPVGTYNYEKLKSVYEQANNLAAIMKNIVNEDNVTTLKNLFSLADVSDGKSLVLNPSNMYIETDGPIRPEIAQDSLDQVNLVVNHVISLPQEERMPYILKVFYNTPEYKKITAIYFLASLNKNDPSFLSNFGRCDLETQNFIMNKLLGEYAYKHMSTNVKSHTYPQTVTPSINQINKETTTSNTIAAKKTSTTQIPVEFESKTVTTKKLLEIYADLQAPGKSEDSHRGLFNSWKHRRENDQCDEFIRDCMSQIASPNEIDKYYGIYKNIDKDRSAPRALRVVLREQIELSYGLQANIASNQYGEIDTSLTLKNFKNNVQINGEDELVFSYNSQTGVEKVKKTFNKDDRVDYFSMKLVDYILKDMSDLTNFEKGKKYLNICNSGKNSNELRALTQYEKIALFNKLANRYPNFIEDTKQFEDEFLKYLLGKYSTN